VGVICCCEEYNLCYLVIGQLMHGRESGIHFPCLGLDFLHRRAGIGIGD
jgi:hypothetical protein